MMSYILSLPDWSQLALVSDGGTVRVSRFNWWVSSIIGLVVKEYLGNSICLTTTNPAALGTSFYRELENNK